VVDLHDIRRWVVWERRCAWGTREGDGVCERRRCERRAHTPFLVALPRAKSEATRSPTGPHAREKILVALQIVVEILVAAEHLIRVLLLYLTIYNPRTDRNPMAT
jgi:hypothetical protein